MDAGLEQKENLAGELGEQVAAVIRDAIVSVMPDEGDDFLNEPWVLEWEGWEALREKVLLTKTEGESLEAPDATLAFIQEHVRKLIKMAADTKDVEIRTDEARLQELESDGLRRGQGLVHQRNDCLADSLLQAMACAEATVVY